MSDEKRSRTWLWIVIGGGAFFLFVLAVFSLVYVALHAGKDSSGLTAFGDKIGVVDLDGVIMSPGPTIQQLKKFAEDDSIKAIIIHVNSPGGGVAASEEIYREVKRIRDEKKKRIVASIETVGPAARTTFRPPRTRFMPTTEASSAQSASSPSGLTMVTCCSGPS